MSRSLLLAILGACVACDASTPTGLRTPASEPSHAVVVNDHTETLVLAFSGCDDDFLSGTAKSHVVSGVTYDAAGRFRTTFKSELADVRLSSAATGASYVGSTEWSQNLSFGSAGTFTTIRNEKLVGTGRTPNMMLHFVTHVTVNANGEITSDVGQFSIDCH